jgi:ABC-type glycerol-3-phosphate transport system permease component
LRKIRSDRSPLSRVIRLLQIIFLLVMFLVVVIPFLWMLITSLMPDSKSLLVRPFKLPWPPSFSNYLDAINAQPFFTYALNSILTSTLATLGAVLTAALAGYAFVYLRFPCKNLLFTLVLAVLMMPTQVSIISQYVTISNLGWMDTYAALIIPFVADAYGIYLIKQSFESIPMDFIEAAKLEGAGHGTILFRVLIHLAKPSLITFAMMSFKWRWNDYFWVLMMTSSKNMRTLPVGLAMLRNEDSGSNWQIVMAATMLVILPVIIFHLLAQKWLNNDSLAGGIKG